MADEDAQPTDLKPSDALRKIRELAQDSNQIVVIPYGKKKADLRKITRPQIEECVRRGEIAEGPFLNNHGNWQVNLYRMAAGEELTCVVAIDWPSKILVINAFPPPETERRGRRK